jgi:hypothetical protein
MHILYLAARAQVALNAGLAAPGYHWAPTLQLLARRRTP